MQSAIEIKKLELLSDLSTEENQVTLASLTVFGYSLDFWNDALNNESNPWHNIMISLVNNTNTDKGLVRKAWEWFKEKVVNPIVETIVTITVFVLYTATWDAIGGAVATYHGLCEPAVATAIVVGCSAIGLLGLFH